MRWPIKDWSITWQTTGELEISISSACLILIYNCQTIWVGGGSQVLRVRDERWTGGETRGEREFNPASTRRIDFYCYCHCGSNAAGWDLYSYSYSYFRIITWGFEALSLWSRVNYAHFVNFARPLYEIYILLVLHARGIKIIYDPKYCWL